MRSGKHYKKITTPDGRKMDEHRYLMEKKIGRRLSHDEHVHHIDGDINNNSLDNLQILSKHEHGRLHQLGRIYGPEHREKMRQIGRRTMTNRKLSAEQVLEMRRLFSRDGTP